MIRLLLLFGLALAPPAGPNVDPGKAGMDPARLARIPARMQAFVDKGTIAGAVTLIQRHGVVASVEAVGYQDLKTKKPMRPDTIFRIMSMTKPVTATGIMILMEEGKLALNDPLEKYLPDFKGEWMIAERDGDNSRTLRHPARPATIRDCLTHTSGMYGMPPETMEEAGARSTKTMAEFLALASQKPLDFEPGSKWQYSNYGIAALGRIIEVVSDQPYEKFIEARILQPLGMRDTFYFAPAGKQDRIAKAYALDKGKLVPIGGEVRDKDAKYPYPEGGLASTAADLAAFYQMLLSGGSYRGRRILSRATVETMTAVHTGSLPISWGLGWSVVRDAAGTLTLASPRAYGHGGAWGTYGWIDPAKDLIGVFLVARPGAADECSAFVQMANAAIVE